MEGKKMCETGCNNNKWWRANTSAIDNKKCAFI